MSAPFNVGIMLLLTDGSVLAQNCGTSLWWRLRPDRAGRYAQGEWKATKPSAAAPLYFASAVLADGSVFIAGGEYSNTQPVDPELRTAERYDPVRETWTSLPPPDGWEEIGDAPCCVLQDGRVLVGNIKAADCAIWDPAKEVWTATGVKLNGSSSEETWTLLPDGSVLTIDCVNPQAANSERFVGDKWIANGATPAPLVEANSSEIGPAILLPNGSVFALGATGKTALFATDPDPTLPSAWSAGPDVPLDAKGNTLGAKDAPACLLPNGRVLCAVGPVDGVKEHYDGPTNFFEFDPAGAGAWSAPLLPPGDTGLAPYTFCFLLLPTGQVLASNTTSTVQLFQPDGAPDSAWAPTIASCPQTIRPGTPNCLKGTQLNGLSQACSYGDDAAMATNYPLVRLRAPFPSDTVVYCRTFDHTTMGVATGAALHETSFMAPADLAGGIYYLSVVANGIASAETPVNVLETRRGRRADYPSRDEAAGEASSIFEKELFLRDLSEVHLLMDFIAGRGDKSLAGLKDVACLDAAGKPVPMAAEQVVAEIAKISYPPDGGPEANAKDAALILSVKDRLNLLAAPAKGMTVAFTSMFSGTSLHFSVLEWLPGGRELSACFSDWCKLRRMGGDSARANTPENPKACNNCQHDDIVPAYKYKSSYSAKNAYPNLEKQARRFRRFYMRIPHCAFLLIAIIVFINWDISVAGGILSDISANKEKYNALFSDKSDFRPTAQGCAAANLTVGKLSACDEAGRDLRQLTAMRWDLTDYVSRGWFGSGFGFQPPVALSVRLFGARLDTKPPTSDQPTQYPIIDPWPSESFTAMVVKAFNGIVIPAVFGLLGTLAGIARSVAAKVRDNVLAPRDYQIVRVALFLGLSAGLAVGLFYNNESVVAAAKSLGSTITFTAAGLSFLAGFGAEGFFTFLDNFLGRLFPAGPPVAPPPNTAQHG